MLAARRGGSQGLALPSSLQKLMEEKVAGMSDADRSVLQAASVVGASFDPAEVIHLSNLGASAELVIEGLMERSVFRDDAITGGKCDGGYGGYGYGGYEDDYGGYGGYGCP